MLHDRAPIEISEVRAQGAGGQWLVAEIIEDLAADRGSERLEHAVLCF